MIKVTLREKKLKNGKFGLYLDFYPPVINPETGKATRRDHLKLYVYARPKTEEERDFNKETRMLAESIRSQRQLELQSGSYGFTSSLNKRKNFITHFERICEEKKQNSESNYKFWLCLLKHLKSFRGEFVPFSDVTEDFCKQFKNYLLNKAGLAHNSASAYFSCFRGVVKNTSDRNLLTQNPVLDVKNIAREDTEREYLTLEELQRFSKAHLECGVLKRASLFAALTGLRFSDIFKLTWHEIRDDKEGATIRFKQKKVKGAETMPISDEARELLGERSTSEGKVFGGLAYWQCKYYLPEWADAAGVDRNITFHSFRHTFATLQITLGTDIFTLSKMLGHRDIKTTQIYAKIIDEKKREAANKIKLK